MKPAYILHIISQTNSIELQLLSPLPDGCNTLHWQLELDGLRSEHDISLAAFYNDDEFVVATTTGLIYRGDIQGNLALQTTLAVLGVYGGKGWLDKARQEFWYAITAEIDDEQGDRLYGWSLRDWSLFAEMQLPEYLDIQQLHRRSDGNFLFYQNRSRKLNKRSQGFWCIDPVTGTTDYHLLDSLPATGSFKTQNMLGLCTDRDLALLPFVDALPCKESDVDLQLGFQLQLIDLNSFNTLWVNTLRWYDNDTDQMLDSETRQTLQAYFADEDIDDDVVEDALEEWVDTLKGIRFSEHEDACWVCWTDGILRKLYLSGSEQSYQLAGMSPLLKPTRLNQTRERLNLLNQVAFNQYGYHLEMLNSEQLAVINFDIKIVDISEVKPCDNEIEQQILSYQEGKQAELEMSEAHRMAFTPDGINVISIDYLALPECLLEGLQQMQQRTACLAEHIKGNRLEWLIEDKDGCKRPEAEFAAMAIKIPGAAELMMQMVDNLCAFSDADLLRSSQNKAALSDVVLNLAGFNIDYLPLVNRYLNSIDIARFGGFHLQYTLPLIQQKYGHKLLNKLKYRQFIKNLPTELRTS
ncbi:hypothetical protein L2747_09080 [Shewanella marinintestina]|uniref:hypothetical protein n=1 Tax=Shewanella marinintestina TaxID=190305 RepID=UPI00200F72D5|nr:hypothetical protein [Shewanella marinintestina]MCL1146162.1 hypothetical protein [Shewanella marinintestina]